MPAKGVNTKKESGRARKAENEEKKKQATATAKVCVTPSFRQTDLCRSTNLTLFFRLTGKSRRREMVSRIKE